jgi:hypothetical protein
MKKQIAVFVLTALTLTAQTTSQTDYITKTMQDANRMMEAQNQIIDKCLSWILDSAKRHPEDLDSARSLGGEIEKIMRERNRAKK